MSFIFYVLAAITVIGALGVVLSPLPGGELGASTGAHEIAQLMLGTYVLPFEIVAVLLLVAMVGALVLARGGDTA